jgi:hypothetical protein
MPPRSQQALALRLALNLRRAQSWQALEAADRRARVLGYEVGVPHRDGQRGMAEKFLQLLEGYSSRECPGRSSSW